jgi:hypothetical protein
MRNAVRVLTVLLSTVMAFATGPSSTTVTHEETVVRTAYAKLSYAVQSRTVYMEAQKHPDLTTVELAKRLQANELRFDISEMSSGNLSDIGSRPYSDFVAKPDQQEVLRITHDEETFEENGTRFTSYFAIPHWSQGDESLEDWDMPVKAAMVYSGNEGKYSRLLPLCHRDHHRPFPRQITNLPFTMVVLGL